MIMHFPYRIAGRVAVLAAMMLGGTIAAFGAEGRGTQQERAVAAVKEALAEAAKGLEQEKELIGDAPERWAATVNLAEAAVKRAETVIDLVDVPAEIKKQVRAMRKEVAARKRDCDLRLELDRIRLGATEGKGRAGAAAAAAHYRATLKAYGIDLSKPEAAGAVCRSSRLHRELLAALEDWARGTEDQAERKQVLAVLEAAGPEADGLRAKWRAAVQKGDGAALAALVTSAAGLPPADVVNLARDLVRLKEMKAAATVLRQGLRRFPDDFWINHDLGMVLKDQSPPQLDEAVRYLRVAATLRGQHAVAHNDLGIALKEKGELAEAVRCFRRAIELVPDLVVAHINLGSVLLAQADPDSAILCFRRALALNPASAEAHTNLGIALRSKGQIDEAIASFRQAIELAPDRPDAHNNLGLALYDKGQAIEAIACFRKAIALRPTNAAAHNSLGTVLRATGRLEEAIASFRRAIELEPTNHQAHNNLGIVLADTGRFEEAIAAFRNAIALEPKFAQAHINLGWLLRTREHWDEAVACFRKAITVDPKFFQAHAALGEALLEHGDFAESRDAFRRCLELLPAEHPLRRTVTQQLRRAEAALAASEKLPAILRGTAKPANAQEALELARFCQEHKQLHATAVRFYADAFDREPKLAEDFSSHHRYNAACSAALASAGKGKDGDKLDPRERQRLRTQALDWLQADLNALRKRLADASPKDREAVRKVLETWLRDTDLDAVRDDPLLKEAAALLDKAKAPR
jgi:tetratricopeptide (TPR) repeat protein